MDGLSILIPVYEIDVRPLVNALVPQLSFLSPNVEIIVYDDESTLSIAELNREICDHRVVHYVELMGNVGRAAIRNQLAATARFNKLLFIDADSTIPSPNFIQKYWEVAQTADVIAGGTHYQIHPPAKENLLRWRYGKVREARGLESRKAAGFNALSFNNLLIDKEKFKAIGLNEAIRGYGHEDTLFGEKAAEKGYTFLAIDNPVTHTGLEANEVFAHKSVEALRTLASLVRHNIGGKSTKIYQTYLKTKSWHGIMAGFYAITKGFIEKEIAKGTVNLKLFDFYRLMKFKELVERKG
jgi:glycosyltransferase involved in cell wall biosynthesis